MVPMKQTTCLECIKVRRNFSKEKREEKIKAGYYILLNSLTHQRHKRRRRRRTVGECVGFQCLLGEGSDVINSLYLSLHKPLISFSLSLNFLLSLSFSPYQLRKLLQI